MRAFSRSEKGRQKDRARYTDARRQQITDNARRRKYGVSKQELNDLMAIQQGRCGICATPLTLEGKGARHTHVDHDHETKKVRGFLCGRCNVAEGFILSLGLTPAEFAAKVQAYLDSPPSRFLLAEGENLWD
jgi:hypothetical protein